MQKKIFIMVSVVLLSFSSLLAYSGNVYLYAVQNNNQTIFNTSYAPVTTGVFNHLSGEVFVYVIHKKGATFNLIVENKIEKIQTLEDYSTTNNKNDPVKTEDYPGYPGYKYSVYRFKTYTNTPHYNFSIRISLDGSNGFKSMMFR